MRVVVICLLLAYALAQSHQILPNAPTVAEVIHAATSEVLVATDALRAPEVAEALRLALVTRGVAVYLLVPASGVEEPSSYVAGLAYAGAVVRLIDVGGSFLVVDRRFTVAGPLIGSLTQVGKVAPTFLVDDPAYAAPFVEGFRLSFEAATSYTPPGR